MSSNSASANILKFERMSKKSFVSPDGRVKKNQFSSPLDDTVAETPSPVSTDSFSPDGRVSKILQKTESPSKPFDEASPDPNSKVQRDFDSIWNDNDDIEDAHYQKTKNIESVNVSGKKSTYHTRYLNEIMNGESPPDQGRIKARVPFRSAGSPTPNQSSAPSLSEEIALAQKLGMAETLASAPESAQRALMIQSANPPSFVDVREFTATPSSDVSNLSYHATDTKLRFSAAENTHSKKLHFDKIDQILARGISDAAEDALHETATQEREELNSDTSSEVPFDCVHETKIQDLESGQTAKIDKKMSVRNILRDFNGSIAGIMMRREARSSSDLNPNKVRGSANSLRDSSIQPPEANSSVGKSKRDSKEYDLFAPLTFETADKSINSSDPPRPTVQNEKPSGDKEPSADEEGRRFGLKTCLYIIILISLIIVGIIAVLIATGTISFWARKEANAGDWDEVDDAFYYYTSTSEATFTPTQVFKHSESNVFEGSEIVACNNAIPLTEMDKAYYGSNWKAFWDTSIDTCGDQMSTGYAVWYSFTTNSSMLVEASTCNNADFDTQITVMSGSCEKTSCVSFNDQACGDQSLVTWYAQANTTYYIMVHGYREATGTFGLTLSETSQNDQCELAEKLEDGSVLAGTTAGATSLSKPPTCDDVDLTGDGVWYEVDSISGFYRAELLRGYTDFSGQIAVYRSMDRANLRCDTLICEKGSSSGSAVWLADATYKYYIYVSGKNGIAGDFDLYLGRNKDSSCTFATRIDPNSVGFLASTKASNPQNVESCGYTGYHTAPGLWFSVIGTGGVLEATTCGSSLDLDTQISVFGNTCDELQCIGGTGQDYPCGDNGSVSWQTEKDEIYNIYVSGRSSRVGDFVLTINEVPEQDGFSCDGSLPLEIGSSTFQSNTTLATSESIDLCTGTSAVRGVWHEFVGTGMTMKISVCNEETDFDARISLFTGSCNGLSCVAYTQSVCGENDEILITTHVGVTYYLYIHGSDSVSIGNYLLTMEETVINDSCMMASSIELLGSPRYFGSTLSARSSTAPACNGASTSESPALWYSFVGTGEDINLSTCSVQTDFNTDVRVFSGSCSEFACVSDVSTTACEDRAMLSLQTTIDEVYYLRIGGTNADVAGNFLLEVNPKSRFFGA